MTGELREQFDPKAGENEKRPQSHVFELSRKDICELGPVEFLRLRGETFCIGYQRKEEASVGIIHVG